MPIQKEAMDREDWDRVDKGLKPRPKKKVVMPTPDDPIVDKHIKFDSIPLSELVGFIHEKRNVSNAEGVKFVGFDVSLTLEGKKTPLRGWMSEADVLKLQLHRRS